VRGGGGRGKGGKKGESSRPETPFNEEWFKIVRITNEGEPKECDPIIDPIYLPGDVSKDAELDIARHLKDSGYKDLVEKYLNNECDIPGDHVDDVENDFREGGVGKAQRDSQQQRG